MNPKLAIALIALSLPLAGCGNKGPLVLPPKPVPVEADLPLEPPADATTDDATAPTPATDAVEPATDGDAPLPDPATEEPATDEPVPPTPPATAGGNG